MAMHKKLNKSFYIRDPVSGDVHISGAAAAIIETEEFQRLRYIKQLGFANLVFPGAQHTRFEHSLGTMQITNEIASRVYGKDDPELYLAGLLHDVGHMPFSHESENPIYPFIKMRHEDLGRKIIKESSIPDILSSNGLSARKLLAYFDGIGKGKLVTGSIGTDRMDYLMRDAYYTGVAYGIIDYIRIKNVLACLGDKPAVYENGIEAIESFLIARYYMYSSVYFHHTVITANAMFRKALSNALKSDDIDAFEFASYTDSEAMEKLGQIKSSANLIKRIARRKLFKRAFYNPNFGKDISEKELEDAVGSTGIDHNDFIAEVIPFKGVGENIPVVDSDGNGVGSLDEFSSIFKLLTEKLEKRKVAIVACDSEYVPKVSRAVEKAI